MSLYTQYMGNGCPPHPAPGPAGLRRLPQEETGGILRGAGPQGLLCVATCSALCVPLSSSAGRGPDSVALSAPWAGSP